MITRQEHDAKRDDVVRQFREIKERGDEIGLKKSTTNLFRHRRGAKSRLDVRALNQVISIDAENLVADVEGMTTFETFVREALPHGVMPAVVPELKSITVGGAVSGVGLESSSFRYGFVHETVEEMEILTGNGDIVIATKTNEHADLFYGFPNTYGTLGYLLRVKLKLARVSPYVKIERHYYDDIDQFFKDYEQITLESVDDPRIGFLEGVCFDKHKLVLGICHFVEEAPYTTSYNYMNIYYKSMLKRSEDYLTIRDYIWRFDADWIWCSYHFGMEIPILRLLFGWFMLRSTVYRGIMKWFNVLGLASLQERLTHRTESVIQDVELPPEKAAEFLKWYLETVEITPVMLGTTIVPDKERQFTFFPLDPQRVNVNTGFYDYRKTDHDDPLFYNRAVEEKTRELGGHKLLYSTCCYDADVFWQQYDQGAYQTLKSQTDSSNRFSDLYAKASQRR